MHCPAGNATEPIWRVLASSDQITSWTPLKPQHSIPCCLSVQWEPSACRSCQCWQKKDHQNFVDGFPLPGLLGSGRASMLSWSLGNSSRSSFHRRSPEQQELRDLNWSAPPSPCCHDDVFLIFSEHPWDKLRANLPHLQFLANNCMYSSHTDIKLCTYCLYWHTTILIHEILYLANQLWCSDFLTPPTPLIIPHRLPALLESLMPLKNWCSIHARWKAVWSIPYFSVAFFPSLKQNFIAHHSSKVSSRPDCIFEIHQLWQSDFSWVYSNYCCSCWFEPEIIKISQSSHKMYSNNIVNFQESTTILNACTKKSLETYWSHLVYIYIYIYI